MPGPVILDPAPQWVKDLRPENASVLDPAWKAPARRLISLLGLDDPQSQVLGIMSGVETKEAATLLQRFPRLAKVINVFHASPHDFEKFDISKIGTGEGAQSYGHGLYFAENPAVSGRGGEYDRSFTRAVLEKEPIVHATGQSTPGTLEHRMLADIAEYGRDPAIRRWEQSIASNRGYAPEQAALQRTVLDKVKQIDPTSLQVPRAKIYEVAIHADPEDFLDWDKPLSQQSESVRAALGPDLLRDEYVAAAGKRLTEHSGDTLLGVKLQSELRRNGGDINAAFDALSAMGNDRWKQVVASARKLDWSGLQVSKVEASGTGANLISDLQRQHTPAGVNEYLKSKGIPGIRYLDQGSRIAPDIQDLTATVERLESTVARGDYNPNIHKDNVAALAYWKGELAKAQQFKPTSNYVLFDDRLVEILKKYGVAAPVIELLRRKAQQQGGQLSPADINGI